MKLVTCILIAGAMLASSADAADKVGRTPDGKPDLNGIWQAMGSAHWNLEPHNAEAGPVTAMGALGAIPGGLGVVEGGRSPNPVIRALLESGSRQGIGVEERQTVGAEAIGRDDVAGEAAALIRGGARQPGERVADAAHRAEVGIRRVQQLAEVAVAHGQ